MGGECTQEQITWWWVSTRKWTVAVATTSAKPFPIVDGPPYVNRLRGQPLRGLIQWARKDPEWQFLRLGASAPEGDGVV